MITIDGLVGRTNLRALTPGPAERIRTRVVMAVVELNAGVAPNFETGAVVYVPSASWQSLSSAKLLPAQLTSTGALAVVVNNDDLNLPPEFIEACIHEGLPVYLLPQSVSFAELEAVLVQRVTTSMNQPSTESDIDALRRRLESFAGDTRTQAWLVLQGGVLPDSAPIDTAQLTKILSRKPTPLKQSISASTAIKVDLPRSGHTLAIANPARVPLDLMDISELIDALDSHAQAIEMHRMARRQIEKALIRELVEADAASATLDPWVRSFDLVTGSRVRTIAAVLPDGVSSRGEQVVDAFHDLGLLDGGICVAGTHGDCAYAITTLADGEFGSSNEINAFEQRLKQLTDLFEYRTAQSLPLGVSSCVLRSSDDLVRGLINARQLADRDARSSVSIAEPLPLAVPLSATLLASEPELASVLDRALLQPVIDYDREKGTSYLESLRTFLALDGQWAGTATALGIHINTLRYRLKRIERLTGRGLQTTADRSDYYLALCLRESTRRGQGATSGPPRLG
jgi:PucR C-terminal helix-turn-helix domain